MTTDPGERDRPATVRPAPLGSNGELAAAALGGLAGANRWPRRDDDAIDLRSTRRTAC